MPPIMAEPDDRYRVAMQQCEFLASEIFAERARHARELAAECERSRAADAAAVECARARAADAVAARDEAARLEHRLAYAHAVITDMERSRFWRARLMWVRLSRRLGVSPRASK